MGKYFADQYSLLHFASGVVAYFWGIDLRVWIIIHILFEFLENTPAGINFINRCLGWIWPGGKPRADTLINSVGDTFFAVVGWLMAYLLDTYGIKKKWTYG